jgi:hypothetical protein
MADGTLKVGTITTSSGSGTITLGQSGETISVPSGVTMSGMGKILQVVTATDSTLRTTTSSSFVTGSNTLSVSITPSSASNKIFVIVTTSGGQDTTGRSAKFSIYRDSTSINYFQCNDTGSVVYYPICISNLDSPNTTSAITYQLYFSTDGSGTTRINNGATKGSITAFEVGA